MTNYVEKDVSIPDEIIGNKILLIREKKVLLDKDLAELYGVSTGNLNKAVKRNIKRFPSDFMFQFTQKEFENLIFQFGTSSLIEKKEANIPRKQIGFKQNKKE